MAASSAVSVAIAGLSAEAQEGHRNAFLCFLRTLEGTEVTVTTVAQKSYSGVFHTATPFANQSFDIAVKAVKPLNDAAVAGADKGSVLGSTVIFKGTDVADITVRKTAIEFKAVGSAGDLQTDANVQSRAGGHGRDLSHLEGRTLEGVQTSWLAAGDGEDLSISKSRTWNQFEVNKKLFNVETSYDENLYTTKLNKAGLSEKQRKHAEKASREIMGQASSNSHQAEERGQAHAADDMDDEDRYSGVLVGTASGKLVQRHEAAGTATAGGGGDKGAGAGAWGRNNKLGTKKAAAAAVAAAADAAAAAAEDYQEVANRAVAAAVKSSTNKMPSIVPVSLEDLEGSAAPAAAPSPTKPPPGIKKPPPGVGAAGADEDKTPAKLSAKAAEWTPSGGFGGGDSAPTTPTGASAAAAAAAAAAGDGGSGPMTMPPSAAGMLQDPGAMYAASMMAMPPPTGYMGGPQMMPPPGPGGYLPGGPGMMHPGMMVQQQGGMMRDPRTGGGPPMPAFGGYQGSGGGGGYRGHPGPGGYQQGGGGGAYASNGGRGGRGRGRGRGGRGGRGGGGDYNSDGGGGGGYRGGANPEAAAFQEAQQAAMLAMQGGMPIGGAQGQSQGPAGNMPAFDDGRQHHHHQHHQHMQMQQMQQQQMHHHHHQQQQMHHQQHQQLQSQHQQATSADQPDGPSSETEMGAVQVEVAAVAEPAAPAPAVASSAE